MQIKHRISRLERWSPDFGSMSDNDLEKLSAKCDQAFLPWLRTLSDDDLIAISDGEPASGRLMRSFYESNPDGADGG